MKTTRTPRSHPAPTVSAVADPTTGADAFAEAEQALTAAGIGFVVVALSAAPHRAAA